MKIMGVLTILSTILFFSLLAILFNLYLAKLIADPWHAGELFNLNLYKNSDKDLLILLYILMTAWLLITMVIKLYQAIIWCKWLHNDDVNTREGTRTATKLDLALIMMNVYFSIDTFAQDKTLSGALSWLILVLVCLALIRYFHDVTRRYSIKCGDVLNGAD